MTKGTPSMGKRNKTVHIRCRRCGKVAFHKSKRVCAACGFKRGSKRTSYNWRKKSKKG
ncbi:MAG: 50S ribosomal protein L37e [Candidatus Methanoliparum thermophilum]|uniref:Large ribosomal subunit protein eL37 n=1 Tax=Methanoliparum thermophilum TaxID=2491083 RepID=A0A520KQQ7_METT2|nr:MAG: 50S ribosomal protein L37e [Candidatus Methanoliparum thermophilum]BDC36377.1 50S ribosomal protein L37e [Candidatus Methanoliparum sp. LAM-1]